MLFGLRNAGQTIQRFINEVVRDLDYVFEYIYDLLIGSENETERKTHLRKLLERLSQYGLTMKLSKC